MRLRFLGTGTSFGVPVIGCGCAVCASPDLRDKRTRHAVLLEEDDGRRVLVDTPPELRLQLVGADVRHVDAVWYTHCHADHVHGVDDLRAFSVLRREVLPVYGSEECVRVLGSRFDYVFDDRIRPIEGTTKPEAFLVPFRAYEPVDVAGFAMLPLPVPHGHVEAFGFRVGGLGYITDAKSLPRRTFDALLGVRTLVLNALWFGEPHPTHFTVEEAVEVAQRIGAERTFLTHLSHRVGHRELEERLPPGIFPAYDGLVVEVG
ncbi:MAG: Phosphoribosyl 1,2-cyclic phosphate phosphodiesterase [Gemmatimonadetes bacterium]|nr:Phosphoribosyl 1,2-cyclic phosphate phosphodiesterase [Gemmatimonadota bacterium]